MPGTSSYGGLVRLITVVKKTLGILLCPVIKEVFCYILGHFELYHILFRGYLWLTRLAMADIYLHLNYLLHSDANITKIILIR